MQNVIVNGMLNGIITLYVILHRLRLLSAERKGYRLNKVNVACDVNDVRGNDAVVSTEI